MELIVNHLHLSFFGHAECLHDVSLTFGEGVGVLYGEAGGGKTALLKCIAGINLYEGEILLDGHPLDAGKGGDVGMVFDDLALFKRRSLWYNLTYPLRIRKVPKPEWAGILAPLLKQWGLEKTFLDNPTYRADEVVKVRLALARAALFPRKVLLIDNPLARLRQDDRRAIFWTLSRFLRDYRGVVLYATDSIDEVMSLGEKVAVLSNGYLLAHDLPATLKRTKPSVYVATQTNPFWRAVESVAKDGAVHTAEGVVVANYPPTYEGKRVLAGISPAMYRLTDGDEYAVRNVLWTEGKWYSVLESADRNVVVEGRLDVGQKTSAVLEGRAPVYDASSEWRVDGDEGEEV